jgi:hypothetical protein
MSALPQKADIGSSRRDVRFVPKADQAHCVKMRYSITSVAIAISCGGNVIPSPWAAFYWEPAQTLSADVCLAASISSLWGLQVR